MVMARRETAPVSRRRDRVLVVDARAGGGVVARMLGALGCSVAWASTGRAAVEALGRERFDLAFCDDRVGAERGLDLLPILLAHAPRLSVVVTAHRPDFAGAVEAVRRGAADYVATPLHMPRLLQVLQGLPRAVSPTEAEVTPPGWALPREAFDFAERAAGSARPALLIGEPGTRKGRLARSIHERSARRDGPFLEVHLRAAPRGRLADRIDEARGGTLFDGLSELTRAEQRELVELAREASPLEERSPPRLLVAAVHEPQGEVAARRLQGWLVEAFGDLRIVIPPLRRRSGEVVALARAWLDWSGREATRLPPDTRQLLVAWPWPGNVRELMEAMAAIKPAPVVKAKALLEAIALSPRRALDAGATAEEIEREQVVRALACARSLKGAAGALQQYEGTLRHKLRVWGAGMSASGPRRYARRRAVTAPTASAFATAS
jgi:NtrC-family two-component system response regulator AlgB